MNEPVNPVVVERHCPGHPEAVKIPWARPVATVNQSDIRVLSP